MGDLYEAIFIVETDGYVPNRVKEKCKKSFMEYRNVAVRELKECFDKANNFDFVRLTDELYLSMVRILSLPALFCINNGYCTKHKPFVRYDLDEDLDIIGKRKWLGRTITIRVEFKKVEGH